MYIPLVLVGSALLGNVLAVSSLVKLDYTSYQGETLSNGVSQWLGMRYAAPPIGDLRFCAPEDPLHYNVTQSATAHGKLCLATKAGPPSNTTDEDCLFLEVYAPSNATAESNLPVYFFIQGGGFNSLSNANYDGSGLVIASGFDIVVVTLNYRVGPYGFLASSEVAEGGSINNGLKDQRKALEWVQKHINSFGGDPCHVTIGGASAGAQSVVLHVTAYGGRDDGLFHASAAESQSFPPLRTVDESQYAYDNLVIRAECASESDTLACLRSKSAAELQAVNINTPYPGAQEAPLYMYGPVLDFDFVSDYTFRAYAEGKYVHIPAIYGDDTNEGTVFAPKTTANISQSNIFLKNQFPDLTLKQLKKLNDLYPVEGTPSFPDSGRYWRQISDVYGEMRYICPGIFVSGTYANDSIPNWNYRWNVIDPIANASGTGVTHTAEVVAIFGPEYVLGAAPDSYGISGVNYPSVSLIQSYWTSFIRSYSPNTYRKVGAPTWDQWTETNYNRRLMFQTNNSKMETVPTAQQERCSYLSSIALSLKQ